MGPEEVTKGYLGVLVLLSFFRSRKLLIVDLNVAKMYEHNILSPQMCFRFSCFTHSQCGWCNFILHACSYSWIFLVSSVLTLTCRAVCSGPWDVVCFIEHLCVSNLVKLLMILVLCYISNFSFLSFLDFFFSLFQEFRMISLTNIISGYQLMDFRVHHSFSLMYTVQLLDVVVLDNFSWGC